MMRRRNDRGSALLLAVIISVVIMGIGGAFLAETVFRSKQQHNALMADEALMMCDAGMERARRALFVHRSTESWEWDDILAYCSTPSISTDPQVIKADYLANRSTTAFKSMATTTGMSTKDNGLPGDPIKPQAGDAGGGVFFGWNVPYQRGAYYVVVRDNHDDGDGNAQTDNDNQLTVTVTAVLPDGTYRQIEGLIRYDESKLSILGLGAVVSNDDVETNGTITIDGQDWNLAGTALATNPVTGTRNPGTYGVVSVNDIEVDGSSSVGGFTTAPPGKGAAEGSLAEEYVFKDGFPPGPDEAFNLKAGTLKAIAQASNTYFTDQSAYEAMIKANGGSFPDNAIVYLDFDPSASFELGDASAMNTKPSILIAHTATTSATLKNVHGGFKGVLLADAIIHVNAGTEILGMVQVMSPTASKVGNVFGNGNSNIRFSSEVLANLPQLNSGTCQLLSWRKILQ